MRHCVKFCHRIIFFYARRTLPQAVFVSRGTYIILSVAQNDRMLVVSRSATIKRGFVYKRYGYQFLTQAVNVSRGTFIILLVA
jgi:hypothetical protein